jgi:nuclear transcription Y subunit beta
MSNDNDYDDGEDYNGPDGFREVEIREQDRFLPVANIARIMKKVLPNNAKIAKDAKEGIQECVSEFISFITSEASDKCQQEKRKTINGDDILWAMTTLGFEKYVEPLKLYLAKYRESIKGEKPEKKATVARVKDSAFPSAPQKSNHPTSAPINNTVQPMSNMSPHLSIMSDSMKYSSDSIFGNSSSGNGYLPPLSGQSGLYSSSFHLSGTLNETSGLNSTGGYLNNLPNSSNTLNPELSSSYGSPPLSYPTSSTSNTISSTPNIARP